MMDSEGGRENGWAQLMRIHARKLKDNLLAKGKHELAEYLERKFMAD